MAVPLAGPATIVGPAADDDFPERIGWPIIGSMAERRTVLQGLAGAAAMMAIPRPSPALAKGNLDPVPPVYPPCDIKAARSTLLALNEGLSGLQIERQGGQIWEVWLQDSDGRVWSVVADPHEVRPMFEVFTLRIEGIAELRRRWDDWKPPAKTAEMPEPIRTLMATRPPEPAAPERFDRWPFETASVEVLRRTEFVIDDVDPKRTFGATPGFQSAARPGDEPDEASATCIVAAGLLFTGKAGERLLLAVDWNPLRLVCTQESPAIDAYTAVCDPIALSTYLADRRPA